MKVKILDRPFKYNPTLFSSLVKHSNNSVFRVQTTGPKSLFLLTKDTINHSLWNPSSEAVDDQDGKLKLFDSRFKMDFKNLSTGLSSGVVLEKKIRAPTVVKSQSSKGSSGKKK